MSLIDCLPHQPPMRLIEEVVEVEHGTSATARRTARPDDFYFQGHFPGQPVVPAVILVELLAQTGGVAVAAPARKFSCSSRQSVRSSFHQRRCPAPSSKPARASPAASVDCTRSMEPSPP